MGYFMPGTAPGATDMRCLTADRDRQNEDIILPTFYPQTECFLLLTSSRPSLTVSNLTATLAQCLWLKRVQQGQLSQETFIC